MLEGAGERLAGRRVPHPRGLVPACGDHARTVGAERGARHRCLMLEGADKRQMTRRFPEHHAKWCTVFATLASCQEIWNGFLVTVIDKELPPGFRVRLGDEFTILVRQATRFVRRATRFVRLTTLSNGHRSNDGGHQTE